MNTITVPVLHNPNGETSVFTEEAYSLDDYNGLFISSRIGAQNFRHRMSQPGYFSTWHVAGDATLIMIRSGILRIGLRDSSYQDFKAGDLFIAKDALKKGVGFDGEIHGHTAKLIGEVPLQAVHIKLEKQ